MRLRLLGDVALVALLAGTLLFWNLGGHALWDPDEARPALIARNVWTSIDARGWIVPSIYGRPYHDKPILLYWVVAQAYRIAGPTAFAARAVSATAALLTALAVFLWARARWGRAAAAACTTVLCTTGGFLGLGRIINLDMLLTLWTTLALLGLHRWATRSSEGATLRPVAVAAALGTLTKGLVTPILLVVIGALYLATIGRLALLRGARLGRAALLYLAVTGPWYLAAGALDPGYLRDFVLEQHLERFFAPTPHLRPQPFGMTALFALVGFLPWTLMLPAVGRRLAMRRDDDASWFCVCWALGVVGFFSLSRGGLGTYVLPAMPALALLTGRFVTAHDPPASARSSERRLVLGGLAVGGVAALLALAAIRSGADRWSPVLAPAALPPIAAMLIAALLLGPVAARRADLAAPAVALVGIVAALTFYGRTAPLLGRIASDREIARQIAAAAPDGQVPVIAYAVQAPSLGFYHDGPVRRLDRIDQLRHVLRRRRLVFVVTDAPHVPEVLEAGPFSELGAGRHLLFASHPPATR